MRDSFIFYRSFFEASKALNDAEKASLFNAICEYSLNQTETKLEPILNAMFMLIKPQLESNNKRYENGMNGGRPKTKTKPKENQNKTKSKANVNVNENDNVNDKKKIEKESFVLPDWIAEQDWSDYLEMRKKKKAPPTIRAMQETVADLAKLKAQGHEPAAVLRQSIQRCYVGVFPIGEQKTNGYAKPRRAELPQAGVGEGW